MKLELADDFDLSEPLPDRAKRLPAMLSDDDLDTSRIWVSRCGGLVQAPYHLSKPTTVQEACLHIARYRYCIDAKGVMQLEATRIKRALCEAAAQVSSSLEAQATLLGISITARTNWEKEIKLLRQREAELKREFY